MRTRREHVGPQGRAGGRGGSGHTRAGAGECRSSDPNGRRAARCVHPSAGPRSARRDRVRSVVGLLEKVGGGMRRFAGGRVRRAAGRVRQQQRRRRAVGAGNDVRRRRHEELRRREQRGEGHVHAGSQAECLIRGDRRRGRRRQAARATASQPSDLQTGDSPFKSLSNELTQAEAEDVADGDHRRQVLQLRRRRDQADRRARATNPFGKLDARPRSRCFFGELLKETAVKQALADSILGQDSSATPRSASAFAQPVEAVLDPRRLQHPAESDLNG